MTRTDLINQLIKERKYSSYLEIGFQNGVNFDKIEVEHKYAVEPLPDKPLYVYHGTSDQFFELFHDSKFDIIFIDGLHEAEQVERDIFNSMQHLNKGGCLVLHDILPPDEISQRVPRETKQWWGSTWRAFHGFREKYGNSVVYDFDCGLGVIEWTENVQMGFISDISFEDYQKITV